MKTESRVELQSFYGTTKPSEEIDERENYWKLIGQTGTVIENPKKQEKLTKEGKNRVLVKFDTTIDDLGLENHNPIKNTLWIWHGDLKLI